MVLWMISQKNFAQTLKVVDEDELEVPAFPKLSVSVKPISQGLKHQLTPAFNNIQNALSQLTDSDDLAVVTLFDLLERHYLNRDAVFKVAKNSLIPQIKSGVLTLDTLKIMGLNLDTEGREFKLLDSFFSQVIDGDYDDLSFLKEVGNSGINQTIVRANNP